MRSILSRTLAVLIIILLSFSSLGILKVKANPISPLPAIRIMSNGKLDPATVYPPEAAINITGNLYTLTQNISERRLEILCDNIIFDGADYIMQGRGTHWFGAAISVNSSGVTIKNFNIAEYYYPGILVAGDQNIITKNNISGEVRVVGDYNYITNNMINQTIYIKGDYNNFSGNIVNRNYGYNDQGNFNNVDLEKKTIVVLTPSPIPIVEPEPFPTTLVIASAAIIAVVGLGILVYFKKRRA